MIDETSLITNERDRQVLIKNTLASVSTPPTFHV